MTMKPIRLGFVKTNKMQRDIVNSLVKEGQIGQSYMIEQFEMAMSHWLEANYCVAVSSGTMADTIALAILKNQYPDKDEVILPALTFIAQVNAVYYNHLRPVFVDVGDDMLMDVNEVARKINSKTLCVFPVDLLGRPANYDKLSNLDVPIVEDACEALGSEYNTLGSGFRKCGAIGDIGTLSFFPSHTLATGEGGMVVTHKKSYYDLAKKLRNHGRDNGEFHHDIIGFNGKMSSMEAALGFGTIDKLDEMVEARRKIFFSLGGKENPRKEKVCPHGFPFLAKTEAEREDIRSRLKEEGIENRNIFSSIPTQEEAYEYLGCRLGEYVAAEEFGRRGFYVPCHHGMVEDDVKRILAVINGHQKEQSGVKAA